VNTAAWLLRDLIKIMSAIIRQRDESKGLKLRAAECLWAKLKKAIEQSFRNPYDKARWKQRLYFEKENIRMRRLAQQT
jgi:hypothetical protein